MMSLRADASSKRSAGPHAESGAFCFAALCAACSVTGHALSFLPCRNLIAGETNSLASFSSQVRALHKVSVPDLVLGTGQMLLLPSVEAFTAAARGLMQKKLQRPRRHWPSSKTWHSTYGNLSACIDKPSLAIAHDGLHKTMAQRI